MSTSLRGADPVLASWEAALVRDDARFCLAGSVSGGAQTMRSLSMFAQQSRVRIAEPSLCLSRLNGMGVSD